MSCTVHEIVPVEKMRRFHEILIATGGHYLCRPIKVGTAYMVDYAPGDYDEHSRLWNQYVTPIRETRRDQWWRKALRRLSVLH